MKVCLITVTFNSEAVLPEFLASIVACHREDMDVDVVAVDNASSDATLQLLANSELPVQIVRSPTNDGYAAGINRGMRRCPDADAYLVLNPDTRLRPGALGPMLASLDQPGVGIVVPRMVDAEGRQRYSLRRSPSVLRAWAELVLTAQRAARIGQLGDRVGWDSAYLTSHRVDWASGSAMLIAADCARVVGPWDEAFFLYSEETDFCIRARAAGWHTYFCADATIVHLGGDSRTSPELHALLTVNRIRCFRKHHGRIPSATFAAAVLAKQLLRAMRGDKTARAAVRALLRPASRHPEQRRLQRRAGSTRTATAAR